MSELNEAIKEAVAAVRQRGEPIEIFWNETDEPWDQDLHGNWSGDLASLKDLRKWLKGRKPDDRTITVYCRGDSRDVVFNNASLI